MGSQSMSASGYLLPWLCEREFGFFGLLDDFLGRFRAHREKISHQIAQKNKGN